MTVEFEGKSYHPLSTYEDAMRDEISWARNHAVRWAEEMGVPDNEVDDWAEWFKDGWIKHLIDHAPQIDRDYRKMYELFQKEKASGN